MTNVKYRISLDIHDANSQVSLSVKKGDSKRSIIATLTENGKPYILTEECTAVFTAKKPDGNLLYNACVIVGNTIQYDITAQTTAVEGTVPCELRVYGAENEQITCPRFTLVVDPTVYNDGEVIEASTNEVTELTQLVSETNALVNTIQSKLDRGEFNGQSYVLTDADREEIAVIVQKNMNKPAYAANFADNDWETIISACQNNAVPDTWNIGDQKSMRIAGVDYMIDIIGKNHDDYADGSGLAPLTFQLHDLYGVKAPIQAVNGYTLYKNSDMHIKTLPGILANMPTEVQNGIKSVNKYCGESASSTKALSTKLFLLSCVEITGSAGDAFGGEGSQYAYYAEGRSKIKNEDERASSWWTRSPNKNLTLMYFYVNTSGGFSHYDVFYSYGISFAFCF